MCVIKFGPSGNGAAYAEAGFIGSANSAKWVKDLGLDCFEYSFGRGVNLGDETAAAILQTPTTKRRRTLTGTFYLPFARLNLWVRSG